MVELSTRNLHQYFWNSLALIFAICLTGCGGSNEGLGSVTGTVTLDGKPLPDVVVEYTPTGGAGSLAMGRTDESGYYVMMFSMNQKGATLGENRVSISTADAGLPDANGDMIKELVPAKYNSKTDLVATVKDGANEINFELDSSGDSEIVQPKQEL